MTLSEWKLITEGYKKSHFDKLTYILITSYGEIYVRLYENGNTRSITHYDPFGRVCKPPSLDPSDQAFDENENMLYEAYYSAGLLHREDGPARIWYYENEDCYPEEFWTEGVFKYKRQRLK